LTNDNSSSNDCTAPSTNEREASKDVKSLLNRAIGRKVRPHIVDLQIYQRVELFLNSMKNVP